MALRDLKKKEINLEQISETIHKIEDSNNPLNKFINTAIYHSLVYNYNVELKNK